MASPAEGWVFESYDSSTAKRSATGVSVTVNVARLKAKSAGYIG